jgi:nucleoside-diphosphate-sugar epimerase
MAAASLFVLAIDKALYQRHTSPMLSHINVGTGKDIAIADLAALIANVTGFTGTIAFDRSKPDGTPRKLLDVARLEAIGWQAAIPLEHGLRQTYDWFRENQSKLRTA